MKPDNESNDGHKRKLGILKYFISMNNMCECKTFVQKKKKTDA